MMSARSLLPFTLLAFATAHCADPGRTCGARFGQCAPTGVCVAGRCEPERRALGGPAPLATGASTSSASAAISAPAATEPADWSKNPPARLMRAERRVVFANAWATVSASTASANPARATLAAGTTLLLRHAPIALAAGDEVVEAYVGLARVDADPGRGSADDGISLHVARITSSWDPLAVEPALPPAISMLRGPRAVVAPSAPQAWIRVPALALVPHWRSGGERANEVAIVVEGNGSAQIQLAAPQGATTRATASDSVGAWIEVYAIKKIDRKLE